MSESGSMVHPTAEPMATITAVVGRRQIPDGSRTAIVASRFQACRAAFVRTEHRVVPYSSAPIAVRETMGPARVALAKRGATEHSMVQPSRFAA